MIAIDNHRHVLGFLLFVGCGWVVGLWGWGVGNETPFKHAHYPPTRTPHPHPTPRWFGIPSYYVQRLFHPSFPPTIFPYPPTHPPLRWFGIPSYYVQRLFRQVQGTAYLGTQVTVNPDTEVGGVQGTACVGTAHTGTAYLGTQVTINPAREVGGFQGTVYLGTACMVTISSGYCLPGYPGQREPSQRGG